MVYLPLYLPYIMIKIFIVDDENIVTKGIRSLLEPDPDIHVLGEANNGVQLLEQLEAGITPDVIVSDLNMSEMGGLELITNLNILWPENRVLVLSMSNQPEIVLQAINAGASGFLTKQTTTDELKFAIRQVASGFKYISSIITSELINLIRIPTKVVNPSKIDLSEREIEILQLLVEGFPNHEIADKLFISRRTVEGHRQSLIEKTKSKNTASLIRFAFFNGLIK